jgi:preprotein translocase subunit SecA
MMHGPPTRQRCVKAQAIFGFLKSDPGENTRKKYLNRVAEINKLEPTIWAMSDDQLRAKTDEFKARIKRGETLDSILHEAFAVAREASRRVLGLRPFDTQLIGGMILHEGQIAEMRTGEGKTLVAVLPAYLNALAGKGVHVVTVNDYLARRDSECVGQVHRFLGLRVGLIQQDLKPDQRRAAYLDDITYVTNSELGFDYLRDNLAAGAVELVLRADTPFNFCVIDEVDSILVDEARTPLIISGPSDKPSDKYYKAAKVADALTRDVHYTVDEKQKSVLLTEDGYEAVEDVLQVREPWPSPTALCHVALTL